MKELTFTQEDGFYVAEVKTNGEPTAIQVNRKYFPYPHDYSLEVLGRIDPSMPWAPVQMFDYKSPRNIIVYQNIPVDGYQLKLRSRTEVESACSNIDNTNYFWIKNISDSDYAEISFYSDVNRGEEPNIEFSSDKKNWEAFEFNGDQYSVNAIVLEYGEKVYFRGLNPNGIGKRSGDEEEGYTIDNQFVISGVIEVGGELNTLTNQVGGECELAPYHYYGLLSYHYDYFGIRKADELILPKKATAPYSLASLLCFQTELSKGPIIDVTLSEINNNAMANFFAYCEYLNKVTVTFKQWPSEDESGEGGLPGWLSRDYTEDGVFECPSELPLIFDDSHIPEGWTVKYTDTNNNPR